MNYKNNLEQDVVIGVIAKAHGIKGNVRIKSFSTNPENINLYGDVFNKNKSRKFIIKIYSIKKDMLLASINGVTTRAEAEGLTGTKLYISRDTLPDPEEEEYYIESLIGMDVFDIKDKYIGEIYQVYNFGSCDIVEVKFKAKGELVMFVFNKENFQEIDMDQKIIRLSI